MESLELIGDKQVTVAPMPESQDDAVLVNRVVSGDEEAFRRLVERHEDTVFALIMRQVGERGAAEDICQDTFVRAYRSIGKFKFKSQFSTWLVRIAINQTSSYFTSRRYKESRRTDRLIRETHDMPGEQQQSGQEGTELVERLRAALATLGPKFREVIVLCGLEGKSYEEAAAVLDIPTGTVRSRLNKARLLLKEALEA